MAASEANPGLGRIAAAAALSLFVAAAASPFAELKPNRIVRGELAGALGSPTVIAGLAAAAAAVALSSSSSRRTTGGLLSLVPRLLTRASALCLLGAPSIMARSQGVARASPASGFWLALAGLAIAWPSTEARSDRTAWSEARRRLALALDLAAAVTVVAMVAAGILDNFSPYAEFVAQGPRFWAELARHLALSLGAFFTAAAVAVPAAAVAARGGPAGSVLTALAGAAQNVPSLALFGLLLPALAALADALPGLRAIGVSGIGPAPALVALTLYALLPMVLSGAAGLRMVDTGARDAAKGMGFSRRQVFRRVELPLALPSFLSGARTALVQTIGTATVAALIGAGGMGYFVFQGLGQAAMDMVIVGVVPVVALSALADRLMGALQARAELYVR